MATVRLRRLLLVVLVPLLLALPAQAGAHRAKHHRETFFTSDGFAPIHSFRTS
jgi:hypothetical protein